MRLSPGRISRNDGPAVTVMDSVNPVGPVGQNPRAWRNLTSRMGSAARCTGAWANAGICCSRALEGYADRINPAHAFHCRAALGLATSSLRSAATAGRSTWPVTANQLGIDRHLAVDLCRPGEKPRTRARFTAAARPARESLPARYDRPAHHGPLWTRTRAEVENARREASRTATTTPQEITPASQTASSELRRPAK